jgi:hypothetical protein
MTAKELDELERLYAEYVTSRSAFNDAQRGCGPNELGGDTVAFFELMKAVGAEDALFKALGPRLPFLIAACRERDDARAKALQEAASICRELASLSDPDTDESAGLKKAARAVETLAQHRGEAGGSDE